MRYCLREVRWPACRRARRTSSFLLFFCFASQETLRCWYTKATHSCVFGASRIVPLITWMKLDREIGRIVSVAMVVASLAVFSVNHCHECQNGQRSIEWRWKTIWSWWNCELRMFENWMKWELHTGTCYLCKGVWRLKDG